MCPVASWSDADFGIDLKAGREHLDAAEQLLDHTIPNELPSSGMCARAQALLQLTVRVQVAHIERRLGWIGGVQDHSVVHVPRVFLAGVGGVGSAAGGHGFQTDQSERLASRVGKDSVCRAIQQAQGVGTVTCRRRLPGQSNAQNGGGRRSRAPLGRLPQRYDFVQVTADASATMLAKGVMLGINRDYCERAALEEQLRYQAFHDSLTGLPNRASAVPGSSRPGNGAGGAEWRHLAVLFLDLDGFKLGLCRDTGNFEQ